VESLVRDLNDLDELITQLSSKELRDMLKRLALSRKRISHMRQRLWSKRDILVSLIGKDWKLFLSGVQIPYLRDVYDRVVMLLEKIETTSELLNVLHGNYLAVISIDVSEYSNDMGAVMQKLTEISTVLLPLSLVTGIFGMNLDIPWQTGYVNSDHIHKTVPFWILMICFVLFALALQRTFKKKGFLNEN